MKIETKAIAIRIFFSLVITLYILGVITDTFPDLNVFLIIFIGVLVFSLINIAAKFIPIEDIIARI
jgi:hypothetical protein